MNQDPENVVRVLKSLEEINFFRILVIIVGAWLLLRMVKQGLPWLADKLPGRLRLHVLPLVPVVRLLIVGTTVFLILPLMIKPTIQNFAAILGAAGLAIGFAFKDYISSLAAGILAVYERPYRPGDWVQIEGAYGEVTSVESRVLRVVTADDTVVVIPHKKLWDTCVYNANDGNRDLLCVAHFYVNPDHDAVLVRRKLHDVALTSPYLQMERPITVIVAEEPWGTHYKLKAYPVDGRDQFQFSSDLTVRGKAALARLGVEPARVPPAAFETSAK